ncbi:hypothetical protein A6779_17855 [Marinobacter adhaerens]|uniref:DUF2971 domain-containing protein n=1 Tax=Marinobacter adhaerens TaxID=1033846 RepID=UPI000840D09E|nr:DUF2971 domain-containing protein [Marinobacter adhaerens]ODM31429.1 hypothetical protein A6779_17855 [Marinobacter adhaerens]
MILYKYYGYDAGKKALASRNLGFRKPKNFNDPFELSFLSNSGGPHSKQTELKSILDQLRDTVAVLSLTRAPSNPLMWAHYGQDHSGFVIGYDVSDSFLSSEEYNLIPVSAGDVVYTSTKSPHILDPEMMRRIQNIFMSGMGELRRIRDPETLSLARKIFLTKHASWVYEEEVRVVKVLDSLFEESAESQNDARRSHYSLTWQESPGRVIELVPGLSIFSFQVPIREVYMGLRNPMRDTPEQLERIEGAKLYKFEMDDRSWDLKPIETRA